MKVLGIAAAVTLVLAFICVYSCSAVPLEGVQTPAEPVSNDTPISTYGEVFVPSWTTAYHIRQKRQSHLSLCSVCCNCCKSYRGCGFCCRF